MRKLRSAEHDRRDAIAELKRLGVIRSRVLVGDIGEAIAARYYGVELHPAFTRGFDLIDTVGRRVQVKALRATPEGDRTIIGTIREPCDVVFAVRLDFDYVPTAAIEFPLEVAERFCGKDGKVSWTKKLEVDPDVTKISATELAWDSQ